MINEKNIAITTQMLALIAELDEFKGAWSGFAKERPIQLKSLKKVSTIESIGSSNRIEGNKLTDTQIEKLLNAIGTQSFRSRDEEEVAGYADLMNIVFDHFETIPLTENYIKQLHQSLLKYATKDEKHRGKYKNISNAVAAFDAQGKEIGIVFQTASPFDTPRLMQELVEWTHKNLEERFFHPLIVIGIFIVHFLAIHPFQDGNGRLSRALTTLLLLKIGYAFVPYSSLESVIEASKDSYYRALRNTQKNIWSDTVDYEAWLSFFLTSLQKQKRHLEELIKAPKTEDIQLSRFAREVLKLFNDQSELTVLTIAEILAANKNTVAKTLKTLVDNGYLIKHGTTRGAWYTTAA